MVNGSPKSNEPEICWKVEEKSHSTGSFAKENVAQSDLEPNLFLQKSFFNKSSSSNLKLRLQTLKDISKKLREVKYLAAFPIHVNCLFVFPVKVRFRMI